jgi:hypothetical protein
MSDAYSLTVTEYLALRGHLQNDPILTEAAARIEALEAALSGAPYYMAPEIDDECVGDSVEMVMCDVPLREVQEIEVHRRTGYVYAVWLDERTLKSFDTEEEANAALTERT